LVAILLNSGGYEIAGEGANNQNALALARSAAPEVILMAVGLPDVDGIETSQDVMRAYPLPIVVITSHYDAATIERAKQAGVMGYLVKPLRPEELSPAIELAIARFQDFVALRAENSNLKETLEARSNRAR
jgi:two-component system, response regulator PdtaR